MAPKLTAQELDYLRGQTLGRLATVDQSGAPQNNPVGFVIDEDAGQVVIGGWAMGDSRKFRNVRRNPNVAFVVDDRASTDPWVVRDVDVRGSAATLVDADPPMRGMSTDVIRITPQWIGSWGLAPGESTISVQT